MMLTPLLLVLSILLNCHYCAENRLKGYQLFTNYLHLAFEDDIVNGQSGNVRLMKNHSKLLKPNPSVVIAKRQILEKGASFSQTYTQEFNSEPIFELEVTPEPEGKSQSTPEYEGNPESEVTPEHEGKSESEGTPEHEGKPESEGTPEYEGKPESEVPPKHEGKPESEVPPKHKGKLEPEVTPEHEGKLEPEVTPEYEGKLEPEVTPEHEGKLEPEVTPEHEGKLEPEVTPEHEGKLEPEVTPEHEGKLEPEATPEHEGKPDSDDSSYAFVEPTPDFETAVDGWGIWWPVHVYLIGSMFLILVIFSLASIVCLWRCKNLLSFGYFFSLNAFMLSVGAVRAIFLLIDPYNSRQLWHPILAYFLYSIGFPCISSAFSILLLALLKTTRTQLLDPAIQKPITIIILILFHFALSFATDLSIHLFANAYIMIMVCQVYSVFWGFTIFSSYLYIFRKLFHSARKRQKEMIKLMVIRQQYLVEDAKLCRPKLTLSLATKVTLYAAVLGLLLAILQAVGLYLTPQSQHQPQPWFILMTLLRVLELSMCFAMSYVASQPVRQQTAKCGFCSFFQQYCINPSLNDLTWNDVHRQALIPSAECVSLSGQPCSHHATSRHGCEITEDVNFTDERVCLDYDGAS